ncbi:hypothetical protein GCM10011352_39860 [Marinobacterium zhoushanense]|uniref:Uncharacterized protein n=1 Tax=Marinobacterium zhoushanense TaxID=1679163 RepID=A0ABQ1KXI3_9GAMM|nr:hypothetical protein [Marinobacterium zhoushanense]GGC09489.1 hypothetical protein GCM10011352_39860 [Marinobacterium zhoushanense]
MGKVFLWMGAVLLAIYLVKSQFLTSKTWTPFRDGCVASGNASEAQCSCLSDYVHERFSDQEVQRIMDTQITDPVFADKVNRTVMAGTLACRNPD